MITRKVGKLIRGKATPFQLGLACVLGGLIGATPGFSQGPGLYLTLMALLLVLNANLLMVSNGLEHYYCRMDSEAEKYVFLKELPAYHSK